MKTSYKAKSGTGAKAPEPLMYVGPTVPAIGIQNRVYTEIPEGLEDKMKQLPQLRNLFVPVLNYPMAAKMLRERSGYIYSAFNAVLEKFGQGGNES